MLSKQYDPSKAEPMLVEGWQSDGIYHFSLEQDGPVYSIDTPPPTVSGNLHLGHVYSYSHADFLARFWRMNGYRVFYPMGYDDNGLPTERLVEKRLGITAASMPREAFIQHCLQVSKVAELDYQRLWQRLGLSIDWRYTYRTIDERSRKVSQHSFLELFQKGLVYRAEAPAIWCPECQTSIAQADLNDLDRQSEFVTLKFLLDDQAVLPVATTRPELLSACVAVFVHPQDQSYAQYINHRARVPLYHQWVPILANEAADPQKGTGVVMCCTFGDSADVSWWRTYHLPLVEIIDRDGRLNKNAGSLAGMNVTEGRKQMISILQAAGDVIDRQPTIQSVRVHERCDTPVEYLLKRQWFVRVLDHKEEFLRAGEQISWHPAYMKARYLAWVENLNWDWCISRQRYFGVPFPLWYCQACGQPVLAGEDQLPVDPLADSPGRPCACGGTQFTPETDVMDTWATSSLSPQIVGQWLDELEGKRQPLYSQVFPYSLRPQAHEIIRTWAFYTIVKSHYHFQSIPWHRVLISGWGIAGEGQGKISKSRGGGPLPPLEMIERYSADAVRYWAASTGPGKDSVISEEKIQMGSRLVTKMWNVARFSAPFISSQVIERGAYLQLPFTPADRWILASLQSLIRHTTALFQEGEYANAKSETENFFWHYLADNYLEMAKQRLYDRSHPQHAAACYTLQYALLTLLKLFAPLLPFVTDYIYRGLFSASEAEGAGLSIHATAWPLIEPVWESLPAQQNGDRLVAAASAVRRYKSERSLPLSSELACLEITAIDDSLAYFLEEATPDLLSVTRARQVKLTATQSPASACVLDEDGMQVFVT